jgi:signal transduction histidine kinase
MSVKTPQRSRNRSFFSSLLIAMVLITVIVVGLMSLNNFFTTRNLIDENNANTQNQTEQNIIATIRLADASFTLFDNSLNKEMDSGLDRVMQEYHRAGNDPAKMDLAAIRNELGDQFDIYIINESGVIEYTTYEPELGVDFKKVPYFFEYLTRIRNSEGFFPDRIVKESGGFGPLRKYAYMPTTDHRYILELGLSGSAFGKERSSLDYQNIIRTIAANNPAIEQIRIFDITGHLVDDYSYVPDDRTKATLISVISNRSGMVIKQPETEKTVNYLFIDLKNKEYGSDLSRIVEITYNNTLMDTVFSRQFPRIVVIALLGLIVGCGAAILLSRSLSQPIAGIVTDVDRIAKGDLDRKISSTAVTEFQVLEQSINQMVRSLKKALDKIGESEGELRKLHSELETRIADRTSELKTAQEADRRANAKLNLLNSVTRHDILNQLTVLNGYLSLLEVRATTSDSQTHDFIKRAELAARNIESQILFTKIYQDIGVHAPTWQNVGGLITKAKTGLLPESVFLTVNLSEIEIYADPLLEKIFYTLLENTLRHGMQVTNIRFFYQITDDDTLHLIYEDNGVGISFDDKGHIFERSYGKHTGFGLFLAKEILSITGLVITETGEPGKGARFEITVPKGEYRFVQ